MQYVTGAAIAPDGSVHVVGRTRSDDPLTNSFRNSNIFVGKLSPDGSAMSCSFVIGGSSDDLPRAIALVSDGTLLIAGITQSLDFPRVPEGPAGPGQDFRKFLLRVDPCDKQLRYSSYLPSGVQPVALAAAKDGSVYVGAADENAPDKGLLIHVDATGGATLSRTGLRGRPGALALDSAGSVYVTGMLPPISGTSGATVLRQAFATKLSADLRKAEYDVSFGDGPIAMGTALAMDESGSMYVAGAGVPPGSIPFGPSFSENDALPFYDATAVILVRILPDGKLGFQRFVEFATEVPPRGYRRPVGIGIGPDGRVWIAITGLAGFPQTLPARNRVPLNGVLLRSFDADGEPMGGETMIPGLPAGTPLPVASFANGRIAAVSINRYLPVTPGSVSAATDDAVSAVAFDLVSAASAPIVAADREILDIDEVTVEGNFVLRESKSIRLQTSDGASADFVAGIVSQGSRVSPEPAFSTDEIWGSLPTVVNVKALKQGVDEAALAILAPGTQGLTTIPVRIRRRNLSVHVQQGLLPLPSPSDEPVTFQLAISVSERRDGGLQLNVPFQINHQTPWLKLESAEGITPATLTGIVDPRGIAPGFYYAELAIDVGGGIRRASIPLTVGPVLQLSGTRPPFELLAGEPFTHTFVVLSSSTPVDFTLASRTPWLEISPQSGRTPQEVVVTVDPSKMPFTTNPVWRLSGSFVAKAGELDQFFSHTYTVFRGKASLPDSIARQDAAPGSLISFNARTSRCDAARADELPWPTTLGSCTLRVNGRAMPIRSITMEPPPSATFAILEPIYRIMAQLPYDLEGPTAIIEIEDKNGGKNGLPVAIFPVAPIPWEIVGSTFTNPFVGQTGGEMIVELAGVGATDTPAPWGDLPSAEIRPLARIEAFVGGRTARIINTELSRTEVGIVVVRFEVPPIAPDLHQFTLRIGGVTVDLGSYEVTH